MLVYVVQLDLDKPLLNQVTIGSFLQRIQYENLPTVCYSRGRIGHTQEQCKSLGMGRDNTASGNTESTTIPFDTNSSLEFGPWLVVTRRHTKPHSDARNTPRRPTKLPKGHLIRPAETSIISSTHSNLGRPRQMHPTAHMTQSPHADAERSQSNDDFLHNRYTNLAKLSEETLESETNDHTDLMEEK